MAIKSFNLLNFIKMSRLSDLLEKTLSEIREIMPWNLVDRMAENPELIILDVREPKEFEAVHIEGSIHVPRGVLESACEWDYDDTVPALVTGRDKEIVVVCRSGRRSAFAAKTMQELGFTNVVSLKTGLRGWNDYEESLVNSAGETVDEEFADDFFTSKVRPDQLKPKA